MEKNLKQDRENMKKYPKISIITPSYNQGKFLEETILSVLDQDYPNIEYIVIDGGSNDESVDVIRKYESRIHHWVSEKDRGQSHAVNKGMEHVTGEIIGWINSDDVYLPGAFRKVARAFSKNRDAILVHGDRILIDEFSGVSGWVHNPPFEPMKTGFNVCSETAFWRAEPTRGERIKEELRFAMDLEFFSRLYQKGPFVKLDEFIGCFRCYPDNKSSTIGHIGREEGEAEWNRLFGEGSFASIVQEGGERGWKNVAQLVRTAIMNPKIILFPYLNRRFLKKQRSVAS